MYNQILKIGGVLFCIYMAICKGHVFTAEQLHLSVVTSVLQELFSSSLKICHIIQNCYSFGVFCHMIVFCWKVPPNK